MSEPTYNLSSNSHLNNVLKKIIVEMKSYGDKQIEHINKLSKIGNALSLVDDINILLEMIVDEARSLSNADAGTLYLVDHEKKYLCFEILQNDTMNTRLGGTSNCSVNITKVPLYKEKKPNYSNVSTYVALTGKVVSIPDVYKAEGFDFSGTKKYDAANGYCSKSMLVIPMRNHEQDIIAVLQLINAKDTETGDVIAFAKEFEDVISSLASQAGIALTNNQLIKDLKSLFVSFIKSIAIAIDEKSPYTGGHVSRVVSLSNLIANQINKIQKGPFSDKKFNDIELEALHFAAWMHDVGKITTPEHVVNKSTKLEALVDRVNTISERFKLIEKTIENSYLQKKFNILMSSQADKDSSLRTIDQKYENDIKLLHVELEFIKSCNISGEFMIDESINRIKEIGEKEYIFGDKKLPYLLDDEISNLCIQKGTLNEQERKIIENHAQATYKILNQITFPKKLSKIPEFAGSHHEKLDGSGYPNGYDKDDLSLEARIIAVADIFEALTAKDRPYRTPMKLSEALKIMGFMQKDNHIDEQIFTLLKETDIIREYAKKELDPMQIDI